MRAPQRVDFDSPDSSAEMNFPISTHFFRRSSTYPISIWFVIGFLLLPVSCRLSRKNPDAILLVHGLAETGAIWEKRGNLAAFTQSEFFSYRGELRFDSAEKDNLKFLSLRVAGDTTARQVFTVTLPDKAQGDFRDTGEFLGQVVRWTQKTAKCRKVTLVCFSAGGIVAREFLTSPEYQGEVGQLITISSPHLGTELSDLVRIYDRHRLQWLREAYHPPDGLDGYLNRGKAELMIRFTDYIEQILQKRGTDPDGAGIRMLGTSEAGGYIAELNQRRHPPEVQYVSVVSSKNLTNFHLDDIREDLERISNGEPEITRLCSFVVLLDLFRNFFSEVEVATWEQWERRRGDGVVSVESQNMANIPAIREQGIKVTTIHVESSHFEEMLEDKLLPLMLNQAEGE